MKRFTPKACLNNGIKAHFLLVDCVLCIYMREKLAYMILEHRRCFFCRQSGEGSYNLNHSVYKCRSYLYNTNSLERHWCLKERYKERERESFLLNGSRILMFQLCTITYIFITRIIYSSYFYILQSISNQQI